MKEIERKFLVKKDVWNNLKKPTPILIKQGYISRFEKGVVRVRIKNSIAYLTIKSANFGLERDEFEYEIPIKEAEKMFELFCDKFIEKKRFEIEYEGKLWEVDEFVIPEKDYVLAEIELKDVNEGFVKPPWAGTEVTHDAKFFNSNLI